MARLGVDVSHRKLNTSPPPTWKCVSTEAELRAEITNAQSYGKQTLISMCVPSIEIISGSIDMTSKAFVLNCDRTKANITSTTDRCKITFPKGATYQSGFLSNGNKSFNSFQDIEFTHSASTAGGVETGPLVRSFLLRMLLMLLLLGQGGGVSTGADGAATTGWHQVLLCSNLSDIHL